MCRCRIFGRSYIPMVSGNVFQHEVHVSHLHQENVSKQSFGECLTVSKLVSDRDADSTGD
jgi:hypothetical protein